MTQHFVLLFDFVCYESQLVQARENSNDGTFQFPPILKALTLVNTKQNFNQIRKWTFRNSYIQFQTFAESTLSREVRNLAYSSEITYLYRLKVTQPFNWTNYHHERALCNKIVGQIIILVVSILYLHKHKHTKSCFVFVDTHTWSMIMFILM